MKQPRVSYTGLHHIPAASCSVKFAGARRVPAHEPEEVPLIGFRVHVWNATARSRTFSRGRVNRLIEYFGGAEGEPVIK